MKKIFSIFAAILFAGSMMATDLTIDFESAASDYSDWVFKTILTQRTNSGVTAHGGSYFGGTDGKTTGSIITADKVNPTSIKFYITKESNNNTASSWLIKVSEDGTNWEQVGDAQSASAGITKNVWTEVSRDLSGYSDVYVGIFYDGTSAKRCIDDVTLTVSSSVVPTKVAKPKFSLAAGTYEGTQSVEITCSTEDATIYYTIDGEDPTTASAEYSEAIEVAGSLTIKAFAVKEGLEDSEIIEAEYTIIAGADVVLDFTVNTEWGFPANPGDGTKTQGLHEYTSGDYTVKVFGPNTEKEGFYYDGDNLMVGKLGGYLQLPAFASKIIRIVTTGVESGSGSVTFNVFEDETEASTQVTSCKVDQAFDIKTPKTNVPYIIKVTSSANIRFAKVKIWFDNGGSTAVDNTTVNKTVKTIENGMVIIEKNGVRYNVMGQIIR